jgi:broad specificity phosphatase PhoE
MPTRITLIRHGESVWNTNRRWQGQAVVALSDEGRHQAVLLAEHLCPLAAEIAAITSSDALRARDTAALIASRLDKPLTLDARLREIDLGQWQGLMAEEIEAWDAKRLAAVRADPYNVPRPDGESYNQVADRALGALRDIVSLYPDRHVLAVTHGGTIRSILHRLGLAQMAPGSIGNASLTSLLYNIDGSDGASWELDTYNVMDHLESISVDDSDGETT